MTEKPSIWDKDMTVIPWSSVHSETWEISNLDLWKCRELVKKRIVTALEYKYVNQVKDITWPLAESIACKALSFKKVRKRNNKWHDALWPNWEELEIKMWRIWNAAIVKRAQLDAIDTSWFYSLVFYRTKNNIPPSHFLIKANEENMLVSPESYLKRNISIETIFLFPKYFMVYWYNTSLVRERILKSWIRLKPICRTNAYDLLDNQEICGHFPIEQENLEKKVWKHQIDIHRIIRI